MVNHPGFENLLKMLKKEKRLTLPDFSLFKVCSEFGQKTSVFVMIICLVNLKPVLVIGQ